MTENELKNAELKIENAKKQQKRIKKEVIRHLSFFKDADKERLKIIRPIIDEVAFMSVTLQDLKDDVSLNGAIEKYKNGDKQWGLKANPAIQTYNTMIKNYSMLMKQLTDFLSEESSKDLDDGLDDYINGNYG